MTHPPDETMTYALYRRHKAPDLPDVQAADAMRLAELAEQGSEFAFLSVPAPKEIAASERLVARALALRPRPAKQGSAFASWRHMAATVLTFLAFGSGSYALAASLRTLPEAALLIEQGVDPLATSESDLFTTAHDSGFLSLE